MTAATDRLLRLSRAEDYPQEIWYFLSSLIFLISVLHFSSALISKWQRWRASSRVMFYDTDLEGRGSLAGRGKLSLSRIPLAFVNLYRILAFRCTLQVGSSYSLSLAEVALTCMYIAAVFTWTLINTTDSEGMKFDWAFYSNRSGTLAASQFPLITVLGTKNNVLSLLTGVSYEKMNNLHRMSARVLLALLWVHAGSKYAMANGIDPDQYNTPWLNLGIMSVVLFSLLCVVSLRPVRAKAYEFFFYTHFALALVILIGGYYHTAEFNFQQYVWPSFLIWGLDRFIRFAGVVGFKVLPFFSRPGTQTKPMDATVEYLASKMVRLRVPRPPHFHWAPGQVAYVIAPGTSTLPIEAHPFSIASIDDPSFSAPGSNEKGQEHWNEITFLINARNGFTGHLGDLATQNSGAKLQVLIDGPYGQSPDLDSSETVLLIAGGTGISYTLPLLLSVVRKSTVRRVVLVWAIRDASHIRWVSAALMKAISSAPSTLSVSIRIHVTGSAKHQLPSLQEIFDDPSYRNGSTDSLNNMSSVELSEKPNAKGGSRTFTLLDLQAVQVGYGRPDYQSLVMEELESASGHVTACVCGSQGIARAMRSACKVNPLAGANSVIKGGPSVTLHVESFGYA